jgi:hypothetical protein
MPFEKGNKLGKGGPRGGGRPSKTKQEIKRAAAEIARDYIEASVKPVVQTYFQLAHGRLVNKWHEGKIAGQEFEADAATTRHFIDKLLPDFYGKDPPKIGNTYIQFVFGREPSGRAVNPGLSQEGQRGDVNGGAIRLIGHEGGSGRNGSDRDKG